MITTKKEPEGVTTKKEPEVATTKKEPEVVTTKKEPEVTFDPWPLTFDLNTKKDPLNYWQSKQSIWMLSTKRASKQS